MSDYNQEQQLHEWAGTGYQAVSPFDSIRKEEGGHEYWSARDLQALMGYDEWRNFEEAIYRANLACENCGIPSAHHFVGVNKNVEVGFGSRSVKDYRLTRYACYLVAMNSDPRKLEVAKAQTYFAIKTREAETAKQQVDTGVPVLVRSFDQLTLIEKKRFVERCMADIRLYEPTYEVAKPLPSMELTVFDECVLMGLRGLEKELPLPAYRVQQHLYHTSNGEVALSIKEVTDSLERLAYNGKIKCLAPRGAQRVPRWQL